jgi:hypothetical protein
VRSYNALLKAYEKKVTEFQTKYSDYTSKVIKQQLKKQDEHEPSTPPKPEDRTKDYDFYMEMLQKHENTTIELSESLFKRLWKDRWDWTSSHFALMNFYAGGSADLAEMASSYSSGE